MRLKYIKYFILITLYIIILISNLSCSRVEKDWEEALKIKDVSCKNLILFLNEKKNIILDSKLQPHPDSRGYALVIGINNDNFDKTDLLKYPKK